MIHNRRDAGAGQTGRSRNGILLARPAPSRCIPKSEVFCRSFRLSGMNRCPVPYRALTGLSGANLVPKTWRNRASAATCYLETTQLISLRPGSGFSMNTTRS